MGGWALNSSQPEKHSPCPGRVRARWRQIDTENREALEVRRQWMGLMGLPVEEQDEACEPGNDADLCEELEHLAAAYKLWGKS